MNNLFDRQQPQSEMAGQMPAPFSLSSSEAGKIYVYNVRQGDTLYAIARRFNTTADLIRNMNQLGSGSTLQIGQRMLVPVLYKEQQVQPIPQPISQGGNVPQSITQGNISPSLPPTMPSNPALNGSVPPMITPPQTNFSSMNQGSPMTQPGMMGQMKPTNVPPQVPVNPSLPQTNMPGSVMPISEMPQGMPSQRSKSYDLYF